MYVIQHKENKSYYRLTINKSLKHFVISLKDAKKFKKKKKAIEFLKTFKNPKNYVVEVVK